MIMTTHVSEEIRFSECFSFARHSLRLFEGVMDAEVQLTGISEDLESLFVSLGDDISADSGQEKRKSIIQRLENLREKLAGDKKATATYSNNELGSPRMNRLVKVGSRSASSLFGSPLGESPLRRSSVSSSVDTLDPAIRESLDPTVEAHIRMLEEQLSNSRASYSFLQQEMQGLEARLAVTRPSGSARTSDSSTEKPAVVRKDQADSFSAASIDQISEFVKDLKELETELQASAVPKLRPLHKGEGLPQLLEISNRAINEASAKAGAFLEDAKMKANEETVEDVCELVVDLLKDNAKCREELNRYLLMVVSTSPANSPQKPPVRRSQTADPSPLSES